MVRSLHVRQTYFYVILCYWNYADERISWEVWLRVLVCMVYKPIKLYKLSHKHFISKLNFAVVRKQSSNYQFWGSIWTQLALSQLVASGLRKWKFYVAYFKANVNLKGFQKVLIVQTRFLVTFKHQAQD